MYHVKINSNIDNNLTNNSLKMYCNDNYSGILIISYNNNKRQSTG